MPTVRARIDEKKGKMLFESLGLMVAPTGYKRIARDSLKKGLEDITIPAARKNIHSETGALAKSLKAKVEYTPKGVTGAIFSKVIYAGVIEEGTAYHPIPRRDLPSKRWLAIPLYLKGDSPLNWADREDETFTIPSKKNPANKIIWWKQGTGRPPIPIFLLTKRVHIEAQPYLSPAIIETMPRVMEYVKGQMYKKLSKGKELK